MGATREIHRIPRGNITFAILAGERALSVDGDLRAARYWFDAAYQDAELSGDPELLARAALGLSGVWVHEHRTCADWERVRTRQRHALRLLDPRTTLALRLRARQAAEEDYRAGTHDTILRLLSVARGAGDPVALAETLSLAHNCLLGPEHGERRLRLAQELIGQAARTGRRGDALMGLLLRTVDLFLEASPKAERSLEELQGMLAAKEHRAIGFVVSAIKVMLTIRAGRFEEAETLAAVCAELGDATGDVDATGWYGWQLVAIRWLQGRGAELVPALSEMVHSPTLSALDNSYLAGLAAAAADAGDRRTAEGLLARLRGPDLPRSSTWMTSMYFMVEAAHLLRDTDTAACAYAALAPFADLPVIAGHGVTCLGSAHHPLGVAALTLGQVDRAAEHLRAAVRQNLALGHWPATVLSRHRLAQALALTGDPGDEGPGAAREAAELGMVLPKAAIRPDEAAGVCRCRRRGLHWLLELDGRSALVGHSVGMGYLATLMANPGQEIPAIDLAAGAEAVRSASNSAQPVLDEVARRTYKERLARLEDEIGELESRNDLERAATLREEREWLLAELAAATGIGGRARPFTGSEERARVAVGKAIWRAVDRVAAVDPSIGEELRATVRTGTRCCYRPR
ncbi:hypothetical protein HD597_009157 [Nonomuraea thailandensis]|uniref:MalT-like TPR region domain-containing protein n=1 Tax=Nonomuraea thailandensis TaxID=1188745 RepID=A0A9X2K627_9ACTN|nr:hypothetical protein [Nonomuraea thailandensis]MCP2362137.1 hypothetical protein [Nonomuraea thailandensis]